MKQKKDYYEVLGLSRDANLDDIKRAYRSLAKKYHPDRCKEDNAEAKFKEIQEAFEVLSDSNKRAQYDQMGHSFNNQGFNSDFQGFQSANFDEFEDIFSSFFGRRKSNRQTSKGEDHNIKLTISFMEAVLGTQKSIEFYIKENCERCNGTGAKTKNDIRVCHVCKGAGYISYTQQGWFVSVSKQVCPECSGRKKIILDKCVFCKGVGLVKSKHKVTLNIPAGVESGMTLKSPNQGHQGPLGTPNGDLYVDIEVQPHNIFQRKGNDIFSSVLINFYQAALGTIINVDTVHGDVKLKVPAGTQTDTKFRLKNKGVPYVNSPSSIGDHYVIIKIYTPQNLSSTQKKLFQQLEELDKLNQKSKNNSSWFHF
ncbi:MAG: molecular chaperone DnaJ [Pigeon pea little leaf phytoplasma]|uniref:Chaperone protein DnaJ n=1 Tax=Candidatus Phytoplasma fabacearum TaxID=2982628 RepID=A0ABU8ZTQ6_9MOLU|nr:molecular chaperone DnaJ ['Bituminaria bituminosa' little leaf phytoplasma]MDV3154087.1 molecular chaperone DnaJ [Pigeon pea little leaf phytoplasma]MDO7983622.1 molecular chaperone DnaJ ['Bituminaria bituminosa' little leaf phytoplasma]MDO8023933.1 molecular chaperone DnaJ ['Bituminaria bituminosa' little leaf phytoplasma]MDO8030485.1 molecular chaperone DnaJ ['Bituminaria bituminosa' little leaf phytoplasma]MDV3158611.1 molecular chaperone DnaJ [Pigeon pea little leaf phytoplasma]